MVCGCFLHLCTIQCLRQMKSFHRMQPEYRGSLATVWEEVGSMSLYESKSFRRSLFLNAKLGAGSQSHMNIYSKRCFYHPSYEVQSEVSHHAQVSRAPSAQ